jgi:hypothetical protein
MDVPADGYGGMHRLNITLLHQELLYRFAQDLHVFFWEVVAFAHDGEPALWTAGHGADEGRGEVDDDDDADDDDDDESDRDFYTTYLRKVTLNPLQMYFISIVVLFTHISIASHLSTTTTIPHRVYGISRSAKLLRS